MRYIFDRLCEPRYYDRQKAGSSIEEFKSLIVKELYRIFSRRSYFDGSLYGSLNSDSETGRTVLSFGIDSIVDVQPTYEGVDIYLQKMRQAIVIYEPRLRNPSVVVKPGSGSAMQLEVLVSGSFVYEAKDSRFEALIDLSRVN